MFTIGIEFSLEKLARSKRLILGGGGLQLAITTGLTTAILMPFGVSWWAAVFTGFLVALSSTAIVLKLLAGRRETDAADRVPSGGAGSVAARRDHPTGHAGADGCESCLRIGDTWVHLRVPGSRWMLRLVAAPPRHRAPPGHWPSDRPVRRAG